MGAELQELQVAVDLTDGESDGGGDVALVHLPDVDGAPDGIRLVVSGEAPSLDVLGEADREGPSLVLRMDEDRLSAVAAERADGGDPTESVDDGVGGSLAPEDDGVQLPLIPETLDEIVVRHQDPVLEARIRAIDLLQGHATRSPSGGSLDRKGGIPRGFAVRTMDLAGRSRPVCDRFAHHVHLHGHDVRTLFTVDPSVSCGKGRRCGLLFRVPFNGCYYLDSMDSQYDIMEEGMVARRAPRRGGFDPKRFPRTGERRAGARIDGGPVRDRGETGSIGR